MPIIGALTLTLPIPQVKRLTLRMLATTRRESSACCLPTRRWTCRSDSWRLGVLALMPLLTDPFWGPIAYAMMGRLVVATVLNVLFVPALCATCFQVHPTASTPPLSGDASPRQPVPIARN